MNPGRYMGAMALLGQFPSNTHQLPQKTIGESLNSIWVTAVAWVYKTHENDPQKNEKLTQEI